MSEAPTTNDAEVRFERFLGNLLRTGVLLAAAVVFGGAIVYLIRHGEEPTNYRVFHGQPAELRQPWGIVQSASQLSGRGLIQLGVLLLIATPVTRVAMSVLGFVRQRDWVYVTFTLIVFGALLYGLIVDSGG